MPPAEVGESLFRNVDVETTGIAVGGRPWAGGASRVVRRLGAGNDGVAKASEATATPRGETSPWETPIGLGFDLVFFGFFNIWGLVFGDRVRQRSCLLSIFLFSRFRPP